MQQVELPCYLRQMGARPSTTTSELQGMAGSRGRSAARRDGDGFRSFINPSIFFSRARAARFRPQFTVCHPIPPQASSHPPPGPPAIPGCGLPQRLLPAAGRRMPLLRRASRAAGAVPSRSARSERGPRRSQASRGGWRAKAAAARWG